MTTKLVGNKPNQVSTNGMLGGMAFQDPAAVNIKGGKVGEKKVENLVAIDETTGKVPASQTPIGTDTQEALDAKVSTDRKVIAGNGMNGGGALTANRTLTLGTPSSITKTSDNGVTATSHTHKLEVTAQDLGALPVVAEASIPTTDIGPIFVPGKGAMEWDSTSGAYRVGMGGGLGGGGAALFSVSWWPNRESIPEGHYPADGQTLDRASYPEAAAGILAGKMPLVDDATWQADPFLRGSYTLGDGSTTFRLPDYNGKSEGAVGAVFFRGDGAKAGSPGAIQQDTLQNITATMVTRYGVVVSTGGAFQTENSSGASSSSYPGSEPSRINTFDASRVARTSDETRPTNVAGCWIIKVFGAVNNEGALDASQLASDLASLRSQVETGFAAIEVEPYSEVLWEGSAGTAGVSLNLSRAPRPGELLQLTHGDANDRQSNALAWLTVMPSILIFTSGSLATSLYYREPTRFETRTFTSGYGIRRIEAVGFRLKQV